MGLGEIQALIAPHQRNEQKMTWWRWVPDDEEDRKDGAREQVVRQSDRSVGEFWLLRTSFDFFYDVYPLMIWTKLKQTVGEWSGPGRNTFREMKKQRSQTELRMYFQKVIPSVSALPCSPPHFSTSSASATSSSSSWPLEQRGRRPSWWSTST